MLLSKSVALAEGAFALALLAVLQLLAAWLSTRSSVLRRAVTAGPTRLLRDGQPLEAALAAQRITRDSGIGVGPSTAQRPRDERVE